MNYFKQSNFSSNSRKMPKINDIDLDPVKLFNSIFSPNSSNVRCESCDAKFSIIKSKKICNSCKFNFCVSCFKLETDLGDRRSTICIKCRVFAKKPLKKEDLNRLKVKELKWFLRSNRISSSLCKEKSDLVDLIIQNFGLRPSNQSNFPNQAGPSTRSFDENSSTSNFKNARNQDSRDNFSSSSNSQNTSPLKTNNSNIQNSNNSVDTSTLGSDWEFINSGNNSGNNSRNNSGENSRSRTPGNQTPTNETVPNDLNSEFVNINVRADETRNEPTLNDTNSDNNTFNNNILNNNCPYNQSNENLTNSRTERLLSTPYRLSNPNLNSFSKSTGNLCGSTESLNATFNIQDVKAEEEIRNLSVRQLKLLLTRNYVNYKGCCEKDELLDKAIRLWNQIKQEKDLLVLEKDEDLCKLCMEKVINCVLLECGHLVTCLDCGKRLSECPICRQYVIRAIRTFKS